MQDRFGRNINYLRLSITDLCNYRCIYCMDSDEIKKREHNEILSIEELIDIGRVACQCGVNKIRITGGEPLVRKGVLKLCEGLKAMDGLDELAITTNGVMLSQMARDLRHAGVDRLNISLDTLKEDRFREITRVGNLNDVINGIEDATKAGFDNIKINVVLMAGINDDEIEDFVNITRDNPVGVRFIELMPIGPCKKMHAKRFISTDEVIKRVPELSAINQDGVSTVYKINGAIGTVGLISPISNCFCESCNRLRVTADGRLLPCLHSNLEYNVRGLSDSELIDTFQMAISQKPGSHHIAEDYTSDNSDYMNNIGG